MPFQAPLTLEGPAVRLEPLTLDHVPELCDVGLDPELWRWTVAHVQTEADMREYVEHALRLQAEGQALPFATRDLASGRIVGSTRFGSIAPAHRRVEIGWTWIGRPWQRTVLNTAAKYLMLRHAFEAARCIRVEFKTDTLNRTSRAALLRIGAREEGVLRHHIITDSGRIRDTVYFSILAEEWPTVRATLEQRLA